MCIHVTFGYHKKRDHKIGVFLSHIPIGITPGEITEALQHYGEITEVYPVTKVIYGHRIDTGDRIVIFKGLAGHIPSYVHIKGWEGFIKYNSQPPTCRICSLVGHLAKDCLEPKKSGKKPTEKPAKKSEEKLTEESAGKSQESTNKTPGQHPEPDKMESKRPTPEELASIPTLQETNMEIFGFVGSAWSEQEDLQRVESLEEENFPPPPDFVITKDTPQKNQNWGDAKEKENGMGKLPEYTFSNAPLAQPDDK